MKDFKNFNCPCGTGKAYIDCCGIFISNQKIPSNPEELMRSRYTAYSQNNIDYIAQTMRSPAADNFNAEDIREWAKKIIWTGLEIIKTSHDSHRGIVEFRAYYSLDDTKNVLHEISEFHFENGKWYYVNGMQPPKKISASAVEKIGRNGMCPCGSSKKYKKCCGNANSHSFL
jgi:SEC-C motif-containing protein